MFYGLLQTSPSGGDAGTRARLQHDTGAGLHQVRRAQSDHQRQRRDDLEIENRLAADPAHGLDAAGARDSHHQSRKDQWGDDGFDQAKKNGPQQAEFFRGTGKRCAEGDTGHQREQDPDSK